MTATEAREKTGCHGYCLKLSSERVESYKPNVGNVHYTSCHLDLSDASFFYFLFFLFSLCFALVFDLGSCFLFCFVFGWDFCVERSM